MPRPGRGIWSEVRQSSLGRAPDDTERSRRAPSAPTRSAPASHAPAEMLLTFFQTDSTARAWYLARQAPALGRRAEDDTATGHRGRPRSLALDSAEPVASAGRVRVSQSASLRSPPGKSEPAAPGWCIRPSALLACSLAQASPDARRPSPVDAADRCGMPRETGDCRQAPRRQLANTLAGDGRQRG
jgi:hypothetical protein